MPAWFLPAVKLILPHVGNIVAAAKPVFTKLKGEAADPASVMQRQIGELQAAVSDNATHIKELAEQLRITVTTLEQGATNAEKQLKRVYRLAWLAVLVAAAALVAAIYALAR